MSKSKNSGYLAGYSSEMPDAGWLM